MRRADIALGNDGNIGLPYWDWSEAEVSGVWGDEVLPGFIRERCMIEFPPDFFPVQPHRSRHGYLMSTTRSDSDIKRALLGSNIKGAAAPSGPTPRGE